MRVSELAYSSRIPEATQAFVADRDWSLETLIREAPQD
jgi:hypothetical protein